MRPARCAALAVLVVPLAFALGDEAPRDLGSLPLDRWEVGRASGGGPAGKLAPGAPRLPFAPDRDVVVARATFEVPAALASSALAASLERVRWEASVSLDGTELGRDLEGDLLLDLPPLAPGKHALEVRARDLRTVWALARPAVDQDVEGAFAGAIGSGPRAAGVLGGARIVERSPLGVESVRLDGADLVLDLVGRPALAGDARAHRVGVRSGAFSAERSVALAAGERECVRFPWPGAPRWRVADPRRAPVEVVVAGRVVRREALGARALAFKPRLAVSGEPVPLVLLDAPPGDGAAAGLDAVRRARAAGATVLATGGRRDEAWHEAVEAAGLLVIAEADLPAARLLALDDARLWDSLGREAIEQVRRLRGRPSVVAWSLARGLLSQGGAAAPLVAPRLAAIGAAVRALDPSRPCVLLRDEATALGFDLPWSGEAGPGAIALLPWAEAPATLGARLALAGDPWFLDAGAVGSAATVERGRAALAARARGCLGVDLGASPLADLAPLAPNVLVAGVPPGGGFASGQSLAVPLTLVTAPREGEGASPASWSVRWTLAAGEADGSSASPALATGSLEARPDARTGCAAFEVRVTAPTVAARTAARLSIVAVHPPLREGAAPEPTRGRVSLVLWPTTCPPAGAVLLVDRPGGATAEALRAAGFEPREAPDPSALERGLPVVLGEGVLDEPATRARAFALAERARRLAVPLVVLRQTKPLPLGLAPPLSGVGPEAAGGLEPRGARALAWGAAAGDPRDPATRDPVLDGLEPQDLDGWPDGAAEPGLLPPPGLGRPVRADARVLLEGSPRGLLDVVGVLRLEDTPEVLCQIPLVERARTVPAARALLAGLVRGVGARPPGLAHAAPGSPAVPGRPLLVRGPEGALSFLESLGLAAEPLALFSLPGGEVAALASGELAAITSVEIGVIGSGEVASVASRERLAAAVARSFARGPAPLVVVAEDPKSPLVPDEVAALASAAFSGATVWVRVPDEAALARLGALAQGLRLEKAVGLPVSASDVFSGRALDLFWPPGPGAPRDFTSRFDAAPRVLRGDVAGLRVLVGTARADPGPAPPADAGALVSRPFGKGLVLLDTLRWQDAVAIPAARRALGRLFADLGASRREPRIRLPAAAWNGVGRRGDVVFFASNGSATARFAAPRGGRYRIVLELGGTPAAGVWPIARITLGAKPLGEIATDGPGPRPYVVFATLTAGPQALSVTFTNDAIEPPERRQMTLRGAVLEALPPEVR